MIELNGDGQNFFALKFYCDWAVHAVLDKKGAQIIVKCFDMLQRFLDDMHASKTGDTLLPLDKTVLYDLEETVKLSNFRKQLGDYLELHHLDSSIVASNRRWVNFLTHYTKVIEDCPLRCFGKGLKYADEVVITVVHSKLSPITEADIQLVIQWRWVSKRTGILQLRQSFFY